MNRAIVLCAFALSACSSSADSDSTATATATETPPAPVGEADAPPPAVNPLGAMGQLAGMADAAKQIEELQNRPAVDPVGFRELLALLPDEIEGFATKGKPKAKTTKYGEFQISNASKRYADGKKTLNVELTDAAFNAPLYSPILMASTISNESLEGYEKGVTVDGNPGFERWRDEQKRGELTVLVAERFLVSIRVRGTEAGLMRSAFQALDTSKLANLAK